MCCPTIRVTEMSPLDVLRLPSNVRVVSEQDGIFNTIFEMLVGTE